MSRQESQEQYSWRTSLRLHNVLVPVGSHGQIVPPVHTNDLVIKICKDKLGIELFLNDIGRSHVIKNLTQFRTSMKQTLSKLKYEHKMHAYWTSDGRIFAKKNSEGRKKIINNFDDIEELERQ